MEQRFQSAYGARPLHLVGMLLVLAVAAYVIVQVAGRPDFGQMAIWFLGAAVLHDLVFLPAYSLLDRLASLPGPVRRRRPRAVALLNHLRGAVALGGLLFVLFYPEILQNAEGGFLAKAGYGTGPFPDRWAWAVAAVLAVSIVGWLVRAARWRRAGRSEPS